MNALSQAAGSRSIREAIGSLRYSVRTAEKTARAKARETGKAAREAAYASRVYVRTKATEARNLARQIEKEYLASERAAARERRLLAHFLTPAARRTRYQRRVVSGVSRQLERGEHPSIARAVGRGREKETASPQQINRLLRYREYLHETFGDQFTGQPNNPLQSEH